jgi:hypothetical protein
MPSMLDQTANLVEPGATPIRAAKIRVHFLDWLWALVVLGVFFYQPLQPFSTDDLWMHILGSAAVIAIVLLPAAHNWGTRAPIMRPARSPGDGQPPCHARGAISRDRPSDREP